MSTTAAPRSPISVCASLIVLLVGLLWQTESLAKDTFYEHYSRGEKLYKDGQYEEALKEFKAAHTIKHVPFILINMGRASAKLGRPKDALRFYEHYLLVESGPDAATKAKIDGFMAEARALLTPASPPPPAPAGDEKEAGLRLMTEALGQNFGATVDSPAGLRRCDQPVIRFHPCTLTPLPAGLVNLSISGSGRLSKDIVLAPHGITEARLTYRGYWLLATGWSIMLLGALQAGVGFGEVDLNHSSFSGFEKTMLALGSVGTISMFVGAPFVIADLVIGRGVRLRLTPPVTGAR